MRLPHVAGYYYFTTLNWSASALALRRIAVHQHLWIPKWLCSTLPIGKNLVRWGQPASMLQCPRCGEEESHRYHVIQCKHPDVCSIHENGLSDLSSFLDTASTGAPDLKTGLLLSLLSAVISASPWQPPATLSAPASTTFQTQLALGTQHVLDGFLSSPSWASTQNEYYEESLGRRTTGTQWSSQLHGTCGFINVPSLLSPLKRILSLLSIRRSTRPLTKPFRYTTPLQSPPHLSPAGSPGFLTRSTRNLLTGKTAG
jgi:hypothetical protein